LNLAYSSLLSSFELIIGRSGLTAQTVRQKYLFCYVRPNHRRTISAVSHSLHKFDLLFSII